MSDRALVAPACPGTDWLIEMSARLVGLVLQSCEKDFLSDLKAEQKPEEQLLSLVPSADQPSPGERSNSCLMLEDKDAHFH